MLCFWHRNAPDFSIFGLNFQQKLLYLQPFPGLFPTLAALERHAFVAQLDRASDYGSEGLGFESLRVHNQKPSLQVAFFVLKPC